MLHTPVIFLIFRRPDLTAQVFEQIRAAKPAKLLVVADGPRNAQEAPLCEQARKVTEQIDWECEVLRNYSDINLGCRDRVYSGLTWAFTQVEEAIILEDDCLPDLTFFQFCEDMLVRYREDTRVMSIAGTNIQGNLSLDFSYFFSRFALMWGWATWRRAWKLYDHRMLDWPSLRKTKWLYSVGVGKEIFQWRWNTIFDRVYSGEINSWAYRWIYTCWREHGLTIIPSINLVKNIGYGNDATHTTKDHPILAKLIEEQMKWPLKHPNQVEIIYEADEFISKNWFGASRLAYLKFFLKSMIRK
ncbi:glycosyltransferase family 2 protein [Sphaerospermopsis sp. FACHB-1194]|uniref:glycosyltransferase family 2 protein n=1 Tax=Sphaerospermopsis sp. FACHB-1194 TaxID=2692862 RepID=UPI0016815522|nr:glycosyltransferase family 2 protein [Sphaerospermopsis sp. FACHB-1194]MBD2148128.1 glycosyltransferase family 2 protein [Sphaerospermopsis sp. FACHB-1194]